MSCAAHGLAKSRNLLKVEDVDLIQEIVSKYHEDEFLQVVDLGVGSGTTALSVFCVRQDKVNIYSIDHDEPNLYWSGLAISNIGRFNDWYPHLSDTALAEVKEHDLLLIDADHTYEGVKRDLEHWLPHLRLGGFVWLHDHTPDYPGVAQAVAEWHNLEFYKAQGLGWSAIKRSQ